MADSVRIDKWLWAARFFKTRSLARQAVEGGRVHLNDLRVKPSRGLSPGDMLEINRHNERFVVEVVDLSDRRGPASVARQLYQETEASEAARLAESERRRLERISRPEPDRRPGKRDRRQIKRFKEQGSSE